VALKRPDIQLYSYLSAVLVTVTLGTVLVMRFGVLGAAVAILISDGIGAGVRLIAFHRIVGSLEK
jgi:O-antigen/teichoic acid export membrane protein